jgi:cytochrome c
MGSYFFETSKIAGGLFGALVLALALTGISNRIFAHGKLATPGYVIAAANDGRSAEVPAAAAASNARISAEAADKPGFESSAAVANETRSAEADAVVASSARSVDAGPATPAAAVLFDGASGADERKAEVDSKTCQGCDATEKGAAAKAGPPLFAIVDRPKSSVAGLAHSNSLRVEGVNWTADDLDQFLASPHGYASGPQAGGELDAAKRADIVEYLRALSDHPRRVRAK